MLDKLMEVKQEYAIDLNAFEKEDYNLYESINS